MNSVFNIFIKQVSAQLTSTRTTVSTSTYDGARERNWGQRILNFGSSGSTVTSVLVSTINFVLGVAVIVIVIMIVSGAFKYITSAGDKRKVEDAQSTLKNAFIALIGIFLLGGLLTLLDKMI